MELKVIQIGTSLGIVIPKGAIDYLGIKKGDKVEIDLKLIGGKKWK